MQSDMIEVILEEGFGPGYDAKVYNRLVLSAEASMVASLLDKWGMVAAVPDGEDSAGRTKLRRMTADELVDHATQTVSAAMAKYRELGWVKELPSTKELNAWRDAQNEHAPKLEKGENRKRWFGVF